MLLAAVLLGAALTPAMAQYYPQNGGGYPPPPGEYSEPSPDRYGPPAGSESYPPPRPEGALPPRADGYPRGYGPPGSRCNAFVDAEYGPRRRICPMGVAKPVGAPCSCPPRGPYGRTARGEVIP